MSETPQVPITLEDVKKPIRQQFYTEICRILTREVILQALAESPNGGCAFQTLIVLPRNMNSADLDLRPDETEYKEYLYSLVDHSSWEWYRGVNLETRCLYIGLRPRVKEVAKPENQVEPVRRDKTCNIL